MPDVMRDLLSAIDDFSVLLVKRHGILITEQFAVAIEAARKASEFTLQPRDSYTLDAERYRYLRNAAGQYMGEEDGPSVCSGLSDLFEYHFGPEVDEVVDEAIAKWKAAGCPLPPAAIAEAKK